MLKIALESLGCSKNLVDAEIMMGILNRKGYKLVGNMEEADIALVNTCGFIESAKQESIETILEIARLKERVTELQSKLNAYILGEMEIRT